MIIYNKKLLQTIDKLNLFIYINNIEHRCNHLDKSMIRYSSLTNFFKYLIIYIKEVL